MLLDTTGRSVEVYLSAAITTNQLEVTSNWTDNTSTSFAAGCTRILTNNTTAVTAVAAPAASTWRKVMELTIYNADTVNATAAVRLNDSGTFSRFTTFLIPTGRTLQYTDVTGWGLVSTTVSIGPTGPAGGAGPTGPAASHVVTTLSISSGVVNIDLSLGDLFTLALTANVTSITFSNLPGSGNGQAIFIRMKQDATGSWTVAFPASFKAITGSDTAVQSAANAYTDMALTSVDNGTRWEYVAKQGAA